MSAKNTRTLSAYPQPLKVARPDAYGPVAAAYLDEEGNALLHTALGIGVLDDRDLPAFVAACRNEHGDPAAEDALLATMAGGSGVFWGGLPLQALRRRDVPRRFGFNPDPAS